MYDEEAIYQDADIEQAQFEEEGRALAADRAKGICHHGWRQGWREPGSGFPPLTLDEVEEMRKRGDFPDRLTERLPREGKALCLNCGVVLEDER